MQFGGWINLATAGVLNHLPLTIILRVETWRMGIASPLRLQLWRLGAVGSSWSLKK